MCLSLSGTFSCVLILLVRDLHVHVLCFSPFLVLHVFMFYLFNLFPYFVTIFSYLLFDVFVIYVFFRYFIFILTFYLARFDV